MRWSAQQVEDYRKGLLVRVIIVTDPEQRPHALLHGLELHAFRIQNPAGGSVAAAVRSIADNECRTELNFFSAKSQLIL